MVASGDSAVTLSAGPSNPTSSLSATFEFSVCDPVVDTWCTLHCKVDDVPLSGKNCTSPLALGEVGVGSHTL